MNFHKIVLYKKYLSREEGGELGWNYLVGKNQKMDPEVKEKWYLDGRG